MSRFENTVWGACARVVPLPVRRRLVAWLPRGFLAPSTLEESGATFDRAGFERLYAASDDPWGFAGEREQAKYTEILRACGQGPFARALDVGCSIGLFSEMLAPRCRELVAVDISRIAVDRARVRLAPYDNVRCERRTLPEDMPEGPFDLVVCSDILYYWPTDVLDRCLQTLETILAPGGRLVCLHWCGKPDALFSGDEVHDLLVDRKGALSHESGMRVLGSRLDVFAKPVATLAR